MKSKEEFLDSLVNLFVVFFKLKTWSILANNIQFRSISLKL